MVATFVEDPDAWYLRYQHEAGKKAYHEAVIALRPKSPAQHLLQRAMRL